MIKLYNKDMSFLKVISDYSGLRITEELETGYKVAQFSVPYSVGFIQEEQKIEISDYIYVVKEVNMEDDNMYDVYCKPYFSGLQGKHIDSLVGYNMTLEDCMETIVEDTGWKVIYEDNIVGSFTVNIERVPALDALTAAHTLYNVDFAFDTKRKEIRVWNERGCLKDTFFFNESTLRECQVQSNTYDLVTRLIPIGKNMSTIQLVNDNSLWVEDYSYTKDIIVGYYINQSVENAVNLLELAKEKIKYICRPHSTYKIKLAHFDSELSVGDSIRIIDEIKGIDRTERISKIVFCPTSIEDSYVECGDSLVSFDDIYKDFTKAQEVVNKDNMKSLTELFKTY